MNPILKNSTGDNENPGNLIHLLAPPEAVTKEEGRNGIIAISIKNKINKNIPNLLTTLSGSIKENPHIKRIETIPTNSCLKKKWNWLYS